MFSQIVYSALLIILMANCASAAMTISGTRIIFPGNEREKIVRTNNKGKAPALVQVWVDDGNQNADVNKMKVPFIVTPPVYRVEPAKGQSVRLIYNGMTLPHDRESVFWFNMLEVPPVQKSAENVDRLELAFRTRIKIFYRPVTLSSSSSKQVDKLQWTRLSDNKGVKVTNPTPYYFSFESVSVKSAGKSLALNSDMVAPFSSKDLLLKDNNRRVQGITEADFRLLNDFGSVVTGKVDLITGKGTLLEK